MNVQIIIDLGFGDSGKGNSTQFMCSRPTIGDHTFGTPAAVVRFNGGHQAGHGVRSGDKELDMWLTRTYIEGGGGGNTGESYPLAWYFSGKHVSTDSFEKRGKKGYVFTVGDEPFLSDFSESAIRSLMGDTAIAKGTYTAAELLNISQRKNHVYHIFIEHGHRKCDEAWSQLLGDNLLVISDYRNLSQIIAQTILQNEGVDNHNTTPESVVETTEEEFRPSTIL